jgi:hypothetical protein
LSKERTRLWREDEPGRPARHIQRRSILSSSLSGKRYLSISRRVLPDQDVLGRTGLTSPVKKYSFHVSFCLAFFFFPTVYCVLQWPDPMVLALLYLAVLAVLCCTADLMLPVIRLEDVKGVSGTHVSPPKGRRSTGGTRTAPQSPGGLCPPPGTPRSPCLSRGLPPPGNRGRKSGARRRRTR